MREFVLTRTPAPLVESTDIPAIRSSAEAGVLTVGTTRNGIAQIDLGNTGHVLVVGRDSGKVPAAALVLALTVARLPHAYVSVNIDPHGFLQAVPGSVTAGSVSDMVALMSNVHAAVNYRKRQGGFDKRIVVFIDDLRTVLQHIHVQGESAVPLFMSQLVDVLRLGRDVGVHVVVTVEGSTASLNLPPEVLAQFSTVIFHGKTSTPTVVKLFGHGEWKGDLASVWLSTNYADPEKLKLFGVPDELPMYLTPEDSVVEPRHALLR